jgi:hypothetical protein
MARAIWPLYHGRPNIEAILLSRSGTRSRTCNLLADTGGGSDQANFELVLDEYDCRAYGKRTTYTVQLVGKYSGTYSVYVVRVQIPQLLFDDRIRAVGVNSLTAGFSGIACFRFLNRFNYGNFSDPGQFGIEF